MKKIVFIAIILIAFVSCEKEGDILKGAFVYYDGAAILQTENEIYGVLITDKLEDLNKQAEQYKKEPTDMVQIEIKGKIINKKDDKILWENKVEVIEIIDVKPSSKEENNVVKLGSE